MLTHRFYLLNLLFQLLVLRLILDILGASGYSHNATLFLLAIIVGGYARVVGHGGIGGDIRRIGRRRAGQHGGGGERRRREAQHALCLSLAVMLASSRFVPTSHTQTRLRPFAEGTLTASLCHICLLSMSSIPFRYIATQNISMHAPSDTFHAARTRRFAFNNRSVQRRYHIRYRRHVAGVSEMQGAGATYDLASNQLDLLALSVATAPCCIPTSSHFAHDTGLKPP